MYFVLHVKVIEAVNIPKMDPRGTDAYCVVKAESEKHKTSIMVKNPHPHWSQTFHFKVHDPTNGELKIKMKDHDVHKDDKISYIKIPYYTIRPGEFIDQWFDMIPYNPGLSGGRLHLYIHMCYADQQPFRKDYAKLAKQDKYAKPIYPAQGYAAAPSPSYPAQGYPAQGFSASPAQGYPTQNYAQQGYPTSPAPCYPQQCYPATSPTPGYPQQSYPATSPAPGYPQQGYPGTYQPQPGYGIPPPGYPSN